MGRGGAYPEGTDTATAEGGVFIPSRAEVNLLVNRLPGKVMPRAMITCFRCGEQGHFKSECMMWKTKICSNWLRGRCHHHECVTCGFAHGDKELRMPWIPKCVRVVKHAGRVEVLGCGKIGHESRVMRPQGSLSAGAA